MATNEDFIHYVCEQISGVGAVRFKKMFGEYLIYIDELPIIVVCDSTVYVKKLECIDELMQDASVGFPYKGAKEHYILDIENSDFSKKIISILKKNTPLPKKKIK